MQCPKCSSKLVPWDYWLADDDPIGVRCEPCNRNWYSDKFVKNVREARHKAIGTALLLPFPPDAVTEAQENAWEEARGILTSTEEVLRDLEATLEDLNYFLDLESWHKTIHMRLGNEHATDIV